MTHYDRPYTTCTICGREVADTVTCLELNNTGFASNSKYCPGHKDIKPVNRSDRRKKRRV